DTPIAWFHASHSRKNGPVSCTHVASMVRDAVAFVAKAGAVFLVFATFAWRRLAPGSARIAALVKIRTGVFWVSGSGRKPASVSFRLILPTPDRP
ncbi:MAG: hypothetical protein WAO78_08045, partial [Roseovarius sp.]